MSAVNEIIELLFILAAQAQEAGEEIGRLVAVSGSVRVSDRPNMVYVRLLRTGDIVEAYNAGANDSIAGLSVRVRRDGEGNVVVVGPTWGEAAKFTGLDAGLTTPSHSHRLDRLQDYVEGLRFEAGLVRPAPDPNTGDYAFHAEVLPFGYRYRDRNKYFSGDVIDLSLYAPASGKQRWVLIGLNPSANRAVVESGAEHSESYRLSTLNAYSAAATFDGLPLAAVRYADSDFNLAGLDDWVSLRPWFVAQLRATEIYYSPGNGTHWTDPDPDDAADALDNLASTLANLAASDVGYSPGNGVHWTDPDPDDVASALDALAKSNFEVTIIPAGQQGIWMECCEVNGSLDIDGVLYVLEY